MRFEKDTPGSVRQVSTASACVAAINGAPGEQEYDAEPTTIKRGKERVKPLSEREVQAFLNDDRETSEQGSIQWQRAGIWRWVSSDGLAFATSDGRTAEITRTANAEPLTVPLLK